MIDDTLRIYFCHPARTGGTSLESLIWDDPAMDGRPSAPRPGVRFFGVKQGEKGYEQHFTPEDMGPVPDGYLGVVTVRHPVQRALDMVNYLRVNRKLSHDMEAADVLGLIPSWTRPQVDYLFPGALLVRVCDGEVCPNLAALEARFGRKCPHRNRYPSVTRFTARDLEYVRWRYADDFAALGYAV